MIAKRWISFIIYPQQENVMHEIDITDTQVTVLFLEFLRILQEAWQPWLYENIFDFQWPRPQRWACTTNALPSFN